MNSSNQRLRSILALIVALLLLGALVAVLFSISLLVLPETSIPLRVLLSILGAAILGATGFFSGLKDTYDLIIDLIERLIDNSSATNPAGRGDSKQVSEVKSDSIQDKATADEQVPLVTVIDSDAQLQLRAMNESGDSGQYYSCFISYSSKDLAFAEKLYGDLKRVGVAVYFAPEDLPIGAKTRNALDKSVLEKHKLLLILSKHSVTSDWVEQEVETAFEKERETGKLVLFPIRIDDAVMSLKEGWAAHIKRTRNIGDFRRWSEPNSYEKWLQRLLRDLGVEKA